MILALSGSHQRTSGCWPEQESRVTPASWIQIAFQPGSPATSSKIQPVHKRCQKFLPNNNFSLSKQSYANRPVKCLFTARWCVFSRLYWRKHMWICSMCVQYVCETSLLQFTEKEMGVSLKVAFFFRQQTTVRMRPFTEYVLTSSGDACVVLNISVCAKSLGNKVINRQKVEVTTGGANTDSCRREYRSSHPGTNRVLQGFDPRPTSLDHSLPRGRAGKTELPRVVASAALLSCLHKSSQTEQGNWNK